LRAALDIAAEGNRLAREDYSETAAVYRARYERQHALDPAAPSFAVALFNDPCTPGYHDLADLGDAVDETVAPLRAAASAYRAAVRGTVIKRGHDEGRSIRGDLGAALSAARARYEQDLPASECIDVAAQIESLEIDIEARACP
jgi:hypothetical protein